MQIRRDFDPFLFPECLQILQVFWLLLGNVKPLPLPRFSIGLRSGNWIGYSMTLIYFLLSHSFVALAVCFWSLSCWKNHPQLIFSVLAEEKRFSFKILMYLALFIGPSMRWSHPVHFTQKTALKRNVSTSMLDCGGGGAKSESLSYSRCCFW